MSMSPRYYEYGVLGVGDLIRLVDSAHSTWFGSIAKLMWVLNTSLECDGNSYRPCHYKPCQVEGVLDSPQPVSMKTRLPRGGRYEVLEG